MYLICFLVVYMCLGNKQFPFSTKYNSNSCKLFLDYSVANNTRLFHCTAQPRSHRHIKRFNEIGSINLELQFWLSIKARLFHQLAARLLHNASNQNVENSESRKGYQKIYYEFKPTLGIFVSLSKNAHKI